MLALALGGLQERQHSAGMSSSIQGVNSVTACTKMLALALGGLQHSRTVLACFKY
jgi:hypothetical protein